jgi:hypothetical protein
MVLDNIEQLIEKYENGETSLQEEQQLKNYFTQETFSQTRNEHFTKDVPLQPKKTYTLYKWISVAAIAVLMFGLYFSNPITGAEKTYADLSVEEQKDYDNAMLAFNILSSNFKKGTDNMTALTTMSESLNHGQESLSLLSEFDNTTDKIFKYE